MQKVILAVLVPLILVSAHGAIQLETVIHDGDFVQPKDIVAIRDQRSRLIIASDGTSGPKDWWLSPHITLYCDPHYKAFITGVPRSQIRGRIVFMERLKEIDPASDVVVTLANPAAAAGITKQLNRFGVRRLIFQSNSPTFAFWTMEMNPRRPLPN